MQPAVRCLVAVLIFAVIALLWEKKTIRNDDDERGVSIQRPSSTISDDEFDHERLENSYFQEGGTAGLQSMRKDFVHSFVQEWNEDASVNDAGEEEEIKSSSNSHSAPDDVLLLWNTNLIRSRPSGVHLVFIGDSITRYQYLSLSYFLRYGRWFDPTTLPNNLVNAHSFHHEYYPEEDWNEFFMQSNRMLQPYELCDCVRKYDNTIAIERRYFYDNERDNKLVYINISGKSTAGHVGLYGRVNPETVFSTTPFRSGLLHEPVNQSGSYKPGYESSDHDKENQKEWEFVTWADMIEYHVGSLNLSASAAAIMNTGLHPSPFHDTLRALALKDSLEIVGIKGVWKTTSFTKEEIERGTAIKRDLDQTMCRTLPECFDMSWTFHLKPSLYYDQLHFGEPVYRMLNEDLLKQLHMLPAGYGNPLPRSLVTR
mmetsp:Transcript_26285/g.72573  ORF Transcript_26285/g.72573 Transcript_26285/m.72573 type:complete len:427 (-) Transcript_26285:359-1639(-)